MEQELANQGCDPTLLSCITSQVIQFALPVIAVALLALGIWGLIRHERRKQAGLLPNRGIPPGDGEMLLHAGERHVFGPGNADASRVYRVSRNPKDHARAMMPAKAQKKDRR